MKHNLKNSTFNIVFCEYCNKGRKTRKKLDKKVLGGELQTANYAIN